MKRYIKYLGIADIILGLLLFALHVILHFNGNELLFGGLVLVLSGVIIFVRGRAFSLIPIFKGGREGGLTGFFVKHVDVFRIGLLEVKVKHQRKT